ncbi:hypothetical protein L1049_016960 [Liquidambar formosana]|uniref:RNase H type-1 domain-containing protein n=1 Tax=Liquidambar formosana TaxID=63359 RepID=A0AAP0S043_LIQFO
MGLMDRRRSLAFLVVISGLQLSAYAAVYKVGDSAGWTTIGNVDYKQWAATKSFQVGDIIPIDISLALGDHKSSIPPCNPTYVSWTYPPNGWAKLNTDGSSFDNPGSAAVGGLIRDKAGNWLKGFLCNLGVGFNNTIELWALRQGIILTWDMGIRQLIIEIDSPASLHAIEHAISIFHPDGSLIEDCRSF